MKDKVFGVLQRVGRSFMLPIALLPVAGLLLGIGGSFTNETMLSAYGLMGVMGPGTLPEILYLRISRFCSPWVWQSVWRGEKRKLLRWLRP